MSRPRAAEPLAWLTLEEPSASGGGGARRQHFLIEALRATREVHVLVADTPAELPRWAPVRAWARLAPAGVAPLPAGSPYADRVLAAAASEGIRTAVIAHIETAAVLGPVLRDPRLRTVLDLHNVYSRFHAGRGERWRGLSWRLLEQRLCGAATAVTALSEQEAAAVRGASRSVTVVANGVSLPEWPGSADGAPEGLAFFGSWTHGPNAIGLSWLLTDVWPLVRAERPDARLHLYGGGTPQPGDAPGVVVHGRVPDLAAALAGHAASLVPIVHGVGTRLKFVESLAAGIPVVTTPLGAEGYDVPAGLCLVAADAAAFAAACLRALEGGAEMTAMAAAARRYVEATYTWAQVAAVLARVVDDVHA